MPKNNDDSRDKVRYLNLGDESPMYNRLAAELGKAQAKASRQQWMGTIKGLSEKGVKAAEVEDSDVLSWLSVGDPKDMVAREDLVSFVNKRSMTIKERILGEPVYRSWAHPSGEYHEALYTLATERDVMTDSLDDIEWEMNEISLSIQEGDYDDLDEVLGKLGKFEAQRTQILMGLSEAYDFTYPGHFGAAITDGRAKNLIVHARYSVLPDGTCLIHEIQSDWAQRGRKNGWRTIPKAPFVTKTELWSGVALKALMQKCAQDDRVKRVAWITESMRNGQPQRPDQERQDLAAQKQFNEFVKQRSQELTALMEDAQGGAELRRKACVCIGKQRADEENDTREDRDRMSTLDYAAYAARYESEARSLLDSQDAERQKERQAALSEGARLLARTEAIEQGIGKPSVGLNEFYVHQLPKIADPILKGTGQKIGFLDIELGAHGARAGQVARVPGFEMTDQAREKLKERMPVYSPTSLLRTQPLSPDSPAILAARAVGQRMLGNLHALRLVTHLYETSTGQRKAASLAGKVINLSLHAIEPEEAVAHECMHYALDRMLSQSERDMVLEAFAPGTELNDRVVALARAKRDRGTAMLCAINAEEAAAQGFAYWFSGQMPADRGLPAVASEFSVWGLFASIKEALRVGIDWLKEKVLDERLTSPEAVFESLADGSLAHRHASDAQSKPFAFAQPSGEQEGLSAVARHNIYESYR